MDDALRAEIATLRWMLKRSKAEPDKLSLVDRIRAGVHYEGYAADLAPRLADALEDAERRMAEREQEVERLRAALKPFAEWGKAESTTLIMDAEWREAAAALEGRDDE